MDRLRSIVEDHDTPMGRYFDLVIQALIVISLVSFSLETLPDNSPSLRWFLRRIEVVTVAVFTVEYILRIIVARRPMRFIFSFFGLIDLLAILPFYLTTGVDLRAIRAFRLMRMVRILKIVRFNRAIRRFGQAFASIKNELIVYLTATAFLLYVSAVGIYYFEHEAQPEQFASVFHALWWATTTLTTVGYGDVYPVTLGGRIFTFVILMLGLGVVAVPAGLIASAMSAIIAEEKAEEAKGERCS